MALIEVNNLTYTYPTASRPALKNISFQIGKGQIVAIIGPNHAGKSTLCLALAGLIPAVFHGDVAGQVLIDGLDTAQHPPSRFAGLVGLVLQNPSNQFSGIASTVYEEIAFGLENLGVPSTEMPSCIENALQQCGLLHLQARSPFSLSGGQQQRLAIASMLALNPPILVLDEPVSMLDPQGQQEVFALIQDLAKAGRTVIMVEHHLEWIARYTNRVLVLADGQILLDAPPQTALSSPLLPQIGCGWLRYTEAAQIALRQQVWPGCRPLPVSLEEASNGFSEILYKTSPC